MIIKELLTAVQLLTKTTTTKGYPLPSPVLYRLYCAEEAPEVILLDMNFTSGINSGNEGLFWPHGNKETYVDTTVILFTAYADIDLTVKVLKKVLQTLS